LSQHTQLCQSPVGRSRAGPKKSARNIEEDFIATAGKALKLRVIIRFYGEWKRAPSPALLTGEGLDAVTKVASCAALRSLSCCLIFNLSMLCGQCRVVLTSAPMSRPRATGPT